ncbi:MAG: hypothetical protein H8E66_27315 [Planctomycetes bacterium]|nr:hypothetical protein [Planctomycetota bacterium]
MTQIKTVQSHTGEFIMQRTSTILGLAVVTLAAAHASAQTNDHFARQRREAVARQAATQQHFSHSGGTSSHFGSTHQHTGHWGGPTSVHRYYNPTNSRIRHQNIQYYPVNPFGFASRGYGFYGGFSPYYRTPSFGGPSIHIHREIYHSR